jgi:site-specific DNA-methyltransferase (adenine-specific)
MTIQVIHGDMRDVLPTLEAESAHSIVTDPPYELGFMNRAWTNAGSPSIPTRGARCCVY